MFQGLTRDKALAICQITKNQFYYKPSGKKRGRKKSKYTNQLSEGKLVQRRNKYVKDYIKKILKHPKVDYGYHRMTGALQLAGFYINHKKVYRLMKEERLLQVKKNREGKNYVKYRIVCPEQPLRLMEMDIKQVWIAGGRRYAYILTILDVFTRATLYWTVGYQMKQDQVQRAWQQVIEKLLEPMGALAWKVDIEVRSDNGPQFCAKKLQAFLQENYLKQTFTHPYTPQENGHVESFHAILGRDLQGQYFDTLADLDKALEAFYYFYNFDRIHGSLLNLPPVTFWHQWQLGNIHREVIDEKRRKVKFQLKVQRQLIHKARTAGYESQREVLSLDFEGSIPDKSKLNETLACPIEEDSDEKVPSDGAVLKARPAV